MRFTTPITIRFGDTDMMGVVYHGNYLKYFEDARTDLLTQLGFPYIQIENMGYLSPVVSVSAQFHKSLTYGDDAVVCTRIVEAGRGHTTYTYEIFKADDDFDTAKPYVTGSSTHCLLDKKTNKPVSVKREIPELYEIYQQVIEPEDKSRPRRSR